jgi:hypothetical protein
MDLQTIRACAKVCATRLWWNWQTRYFEVVVPQGVQVQILLTAPLFLHSQMLPFKILSGISFAKCANRLEHCDCEEW